MPLHVPVGRGFAGRIAERGEPMVLDYFYYTALTVAACYEKASVDQQREWRGLLTAHLEQLREWTDNWSRGAVRP